MKQVVTNKGGDLQVIEVPSPSLLPGFVLVRTRFSLISAGTEGAQVREGKAGILTKVREHPDQVRQVLAKVKKEGVRAAVSQVKEKLGQWRPLGYSLSGEVANVGEGVGDLVPGDRVACAGAGYAVHAEQVAVPRNLVARVPGGVDLRHAAFVTLGTIALHGVRRASPTLGETALVVGLGLVGQMAVQFLRASGVQVAVLDPDRSRVELALELGAELALDPARDGEAEIGGWTRGMGVDMALICAASSSSEPVRGAARLLRDRGRMVVVGEVGLELERGPFFAKEIDFSLSRSYGPGRYDPHYEEGGADYPVGYVRWTEGRNLDAVLDLIGRGQIRVDPLITEEVLLEEAPHVYEKILGGAGGLGTLLRYEDEPEQRHTLRLSEPPAVSDRAGVLLVGAGWFARTFHIPNLLQEPKLRLAGVVTRSGANALQIAEKGGAPFAGTSYEEGLEQPGVDAVLICTRHNLHVPQALAAIRAGKHVLLEKPMALDVEGLRALAGAIQQTPVRFAVGFNRRFAPLAGDLKRLTEGKGPIQATYRVNAGRLPPDHWAQDPVEGGGRLVGEGCHVFDFFNFLTEVDPVSVQARMVLSKDSAVRGEDNLTATVAYADGSVCTLLYSTTGPPGYPKESLEVFAPGLVATLTDYKELVWTGKESNRKTLRTEDKGQAEEMKAWARYLAGESPPVADFQTAALSTWLTLRALEAARTGQTLEVASTLSGVLGG